ncbi:MAG: alpha/beta hydrolase [Alphaproteobacteria bacterium]
MAVFPGNPAREGQCLSLGPAGFHTLAYVEWGQREAMRTIICAHGLTRNARDFDWLAASLGKIENWRIICPDVVGRGRSDHLAPTAIHAYNYPQYLFDAATLLAHLNARYVDWIGTSMGGLIGMFLAAYPGTPIQRLVLNDVGPFIPKQAIERIQRYIGDANQSFLSIEAVEKYLRQIYAPFGELTDAQWRHMAIHSARETSKGYILAYDPNIGTALGATQIQDVDLWSVWEQINCPILLIHGVKSDLLLSQTVREMLARGPGAKGLVEVLEVREAGHAPALRNDEQINAIQNWLLKSN